MQFHALKPHAGFNTERHEAVYGHAKFCKFVANVCLYIQVFPGRAGGGSLRRKRTIKQRQETNQCDAQAAFFARASVHGEICL